MKPKTQRQLEANARKEEAEKLTPQQRIAKLDKLGLKATKERKKLQKRLEA